MDKVYIRELIKTILSYRLKILLILAMCVGFSFSLTVLMRKSYVSNFEINVYSKYFQNPLISGVIPDMYNLPEMRYVIDSMVKEAINDDFIDEIGRDYNIYSKNADERELALERQQLRNNFKHYPTGGLSYAISFTHSDPFVAKEISEKTLKLVKNHIISKRIKTIELVKEVMIKKLNSYNASQKFVQQGADKALASKSPDVLREELVKLNNNIEAMGKQYSGSHPIIQNLMGRRRVVSDWLSEYDMSKVINETELPVAMSHDKAVAEHLSSKFYTKYHDFSIALEIERKSLESYIGIIIRPQLPTSPVTPKKKLFVSLGFLLGLVIAFVYVYLCEVIIPSKEEKLEAESVLLGAPILGVMPIMGKNNTVKAPALNGGDALSIMEEAKSLG